MEKIELRSGLVKRIHINQHVIKRNKKEGTRNPVITVKTSTDNHYGSRVEIHGDSEVIYSPDKALSCGATVWIRTKAHVSIFEPSVYPGI